MEQMERKSKSSLMILAFIGTFIVGVVFGIGLTIIVLIGLAANNTENVSTGPQEQPDYVSTPPNATSAPAYLEDWRTGLEEAGMRAAQEYEENLQAQMELEEQQRMRQALDNFNFQLQQLRERLRWSQIQDIFVDPEDVGVSN